MLVPTWFFILALVVIGWQAFLLLMALFAPVMRYNMERFEAPAIHSERFLKSLESLTDAQVNHHTSLQVLTNGEEFYAAQLQAIRGATQSINLEAYIFQRGQVAQKFLAALAERARAGVKVNVVLDAIGSFQLRAAIAETCAKPAARSRFTIHSAGAVLPTSTTARTVNCWSWMAVVVSSAVQGSPITG